MQTGRKFRLHPTTEQSETLSGWIGCIRSVLREKHKEAEYLFWLKHWAIFSPSFTKDAETGPIINQACAHLKRDTTKPWLRETPCDLYTPAMQAYKQSWDRFFKNPKLFGRPSAPKHETYNSVTLVGKYFRIENDQLVVLAGKLGTIPFTKHRKCDTPKQVTISRDGDRWYLSFNFDDGITPVEPESVFREVLNSPEPSALIEGFDRGVNNPVWGSKLGEIQVPEITQTRLSRWDRVIRRQQELLSRKKRGSRNREKVKQKISRVHRKIRNTRDNFAHQVSHRIVTESPARILVFEDLRLKNMTRSPKPVPSEDGSGFEPNGSAAKAGLNRALLGNVLGRILVLSKYKASRHGKAVLEVNPARSSQECRICGYTDPENRHGGQFHCLSCGNHEHADANASGTIENRGLDVLYEFQAVETTACKKPPKPGYQKAPASTPQA